MRIGSWASYFSRAYLNPPTGKSHDNRRAGQRINRRPGLGESPSYRELYLLGRTTSAQRLRPDTARGAQDDIGRRHGSGLGQRELSSTEVIGFDSRGWIELDPGPYLITFNEVVNLPLDVIALGRPRSSLLRSGVSIHTAVWDAGYKGRSQALLVVQNHLGYRLQRDARVAQLVFFRLSTPASQGYQGRFWGENI